MKKIPQSLDRVAQIFPTSDSRMEDLAVQNPRALSAVSHTKQSIPLISIC